MARRPHDPSAPYGRRKSAAEVRDRLIRGLTRSNPFAAVECPPPAGSNSPSLMITLPTGQRFIVTVAEEFEVFPSGRS